MSRRQHQKHRLLSAQVMLVILVLFAISCYHASGLQIPKDVEILDGYEFDDSPEFYPTDATHEARSLLLGLQKSIRNKRSSMAYDLAKQSIASSATTAFSAPASSSSSDTKQEQQQQQHSSVDGSSRAAQRSVNSVSSQQIEVSDAQQHRMDMDMDDGRAQLKHLPRAEQQVMDPDFDYYSQRRISTWSDAYKTGSSDGGPVKSASNDDGDDDTQAEATNNLMSRGRQARVNFITQPKKESGSNKEVPEPVVVAKVPLLNAAFYDTKYGLALPSYNYEMYPSRSYDPYLRRYDRFDEQYPRFDPYTFEDQYLYRRHYDPYDSYSPRIPQYPEPYYNYPDRHYDIPEPRDYTSSSLYNNEVYDKAAAYPEAKYSPSVYPSSRYPDYPLNPSSKYPNYPLNPSVKYPEYPLNPSGKYPEYPLNPSLKYPDYPLNPSSKYPDYPLNPPSSKYPDFSRNQRRFVYYAHLPEIVRTPYDLPFRYNRDRYDGTLTSNNGISTVYKPDKSNGNPQSSGSGGGGGGSGAGGVPIGADHPYDYTKRDKKDHVTPKPNKLNATSRQ